MMKKQITGFSVFQTSKILGIICGCMAIVFVPFLLYPALGGENGRSMIFFSMAMPFLYAIIGFILTALFCWIYNILAKHIGGIEFSLKDVG